MTDLSEKVDNCVPIKGPQCIAHYLTIIHLIYHHGADLVKYLNKIIILHGPVMCYFSR